MYLTGITSRSIAVAAAVSAVFALFLAPTPAWAQNKSQQQLRTNLLQCSAICHDPSSVAAQSDEYVTCCVGCVKSAAQLGRDAVAYAKKSLEWRLICLVVGIILALLVMWVLYHPGKTFFGGGACLLGVVGVMVGVAAMTYFMEDDYIAAGDINEVQLFKDADEGLYYMAKRGVVDGSVKECQCTNVVKETCTLAGTECQNQLLKYPGVLKDLPVFTDAQKANANLVKDRQKAAEADLLEFLRVPKDRSLRTVERTQGEDSIEKRLSDNERLARVMVARRGLLNHKLVTPIIVLVAGPLLAWLCMVFLWGRFRAKNARKQWRTSVTPGKGG